MEEGWNDSGGRRPKKAEKILTATFILKKSHVDEIISRILQR
jgi:hypothetical protein